ncbi:MAG TPA: B12-binding domain-containing radical SAM protein, partial [Thermoplasmatales archaeon]|nr:B12-binding domain-containing radical SAM protein [Thermoplasmatales archaeon]
MDRVDVLLTCDRTLMSNHHGKEFLGFGTSAPPNWLPEWLFRYLFFPKIKKVNGLPWQAPYGLRKIEAKLIDEGIDALVVDPDDLAKYRAKIVGIYVMDPFGWGPSSTTFAGIMKTGEPYLAKYFKKLLQSKGYKKLKEEGAKTIVGGPGVWQFRYKSEFLDEYGIDCVFDGEGELAVNLIRDALNGKKLPRFHNEHGAPSLEEIPTIRKASVNGLIEIGRGCPRGCKFCSVTLRPLRWYPYEKIEKEMKVNVEAGVKGGILHAEDVLLYGQKGVIPNEEKIIKLNELAKKYYDTISWSHASFAAVAAKPKLIEKVAEIICDEKQRWWGAEMGIETGSPELIKKAMPAKAKPFKPEQYPEIVKEAAGIMTDNNLIPACTLITGLPEETEDDIIKTIELMDDLKDFKSVIVPLFFVPMGKLKDKDWFKEHEMNELHRELLIKCLQHDIKWVKIIANEYFQEKKSYALLKSCYALIVKKIEW